MAQRWRRKTWRHRRLITEHAFDKLRLLDCTFAEFEAALDGAEIIDERELGDESVKELLLTVEWRRPLHAVVVVDDARSEERSSRSMSLMRIGGPAITVGDADAMRTV